MTEQPISLDRRRLLQLAAGGAAVTAVAAPRAGAAVARLKVGVLVPTGGEVTGGASSFLAGIRLRLEQVQHRSTLSVEEVPLGVGGARSAAQRLLERRRVDVVVAGVTAPVARSLAPQFESARVPLLLANVGAHSVPPAARSRYVLHFGLDYWQSSMLLGAWAARALGRRAVVAAPMADSGYDTIYGFRRGLEQAGGEVADVLVSHPAGTPGIDEVLDGIAAAQPDFVYALYSGWRGREFLRRYRARRDVARIPLAGGGLMVEDSIVPRLPSTALWMPNALPWLRGLRTPANRAFVGAYSARVGSPPDVFSLLGYEAALLATTGAAVGGRNLIDALGGRPIAAPRGTLQVDAASRTVRGPMHIRQVRRVGGRLVNVSLATVADARHPALTELDSPLASAYLNEYLHTS